MGGSGFIGSAVCQAINSMGNEVVSVSRSGNPDIAEPWVDNVKWVKADIFKPEEWKDEAVGCSAVIDCVGIIVEDRKRNITFQRMNTDSALILAEASAAMNIEKLILISVSGKPPFIPEAYLTTKRKAEDLLQEFPFSLTVLRPGLVYGPRRLWTYALKLILDSAYMLTLGRSDLPLHVKDVAKAVAAASVSADITGVLDVAKIRKISSEGLKRE